MEGKNVVEGLNESFCQPDEYLDSGPPDVTCAEFLFQTYTFQKYLSLLINWKKIYEAMLFKTNEFWQ